MYAPGQDGQIQEDWWKAKEWHTGQMPVTPSPVTGWPSAVYDPSATHLEVYAPGTDGQDGKDGEAGKTVTVNNVTDVPEKDEERSENAST